MWGQPPLACLSAAEGAVRLAKRGLQLKKDGHDGRLDVSLLVAKKIRANS